MKCLTPPFTAASISAARFDGVVEVVAERVGDRFRHHDRAGEMHDCVDAVLADEPADQALVADVAFDERGAGRHGPAEAGGQVVEHHHAARPRRSARAPCGCRYSRRRRSPELSSLRSCQPLMPYLAVEPLTMPQASLQASRPRRRQALILRQHLKNCHEKTHPQGRVPGRRPRHALPAGHQGHAQGDAHRRRPAGIQHVVDEARAAGIEHFIFVTGRNKGVIEDHFDSQFELERTLAERGKTEGARRS